LFSRFEAWNVLTKNGNDIIITGHSNPDGDAIGSCFALAQALALCGKKPVILLGEYSDKFDFLAGKEFLYTGKDWNSLTCDVFVSLDCGDESRVGAVREIFNRTPITINIDHHISNNNFARYNYIDTEASSTAEVVFNIINMSVPVDKDIAAALYMGMASDTGGFRFANCTPYTMEIAALLMRTGIDHAAIQQNALYDRSKVEMKVLGLVLKNMEFAENHPIAYSVLSIEELEEIGAKGTDLSSLSEFLRSTKGIKVAACFTQRPGGNVKVSLRSSGNVDVNAVCMDFGGGGHKNAAGTIIKTDEPISKVAADVIERVKKEIDKS